jgi:hypothetical protein
MTRRPCLIVAVAATAVLSAAPLRAQSVDTSKAVKLVNLDLTVPDSPAFVILGLSPEKIVRPGAPRDLATTILNGVDQHGNFQSGLAVDFAPLFLFAGNDLKYVDYRDHKGTQIGGRTQVSFATTKGASETDKSVRAAVGLRSTLWDMGDPRLDQKLVDCLDAIVVPAPAVALLTQDARTAWEAEQGKILRPKVEACQSASANRRWNASSFAVGVAPSFQSPTGASDDFTYEGAAVWASFAYKLSTIGQFVAQGRYRNNERVPDKNTKGSFFEQDSAGLGLRLILGEPVRAFVLESEIGRTSPTNAEATTSFTVSGGAQIKLSDDMWLSASVGGALKGGGDEQRGMFVLSSLKWALSRQPSIKAPGQ